MKDFYEMMFKRKSVRAFDPQLTISAEEMEGIKAFASSLKAFDSSIKTAFKIVPRSETTAKWGEYCIMWYSEKTDGYLINCGYMLEQLDLYLASIDIGACWYGLAHTKEKKQEGLNFVIMIAFGKSKPSDFRANPSETKRRYEQWSGAFSDAVKNASMLAPSSCNSQPWQIFSGNNSIEIYRDPKRRSIIPPILKTFFNKIDMGIFLCFLETALTHENYSFRREELSKENEKLEPVALYTIT